MFGCSNVSGSDDSSLKTHMFELTQYVRFLQQLLGGTRLAACPGLFHIYNLAHKLFPGRCVDGNVDRPLAAGT